VRDSANAEEQRSPGMWCAGASPFTGPDSGDRPNIIRWSGRGYLSAAETVLSVLLRFVPRRCVTPMMATAIPDATRPYSMAVATFSSSKI
jgi:hypothetical protein